MELLFNPFGEFQWSPEGPFSQIHYPHLNAGAPRIFSGLLRSLQMLKIEWGEEINEKLPHLCIPSKTANLVPKFAMADLPWAELRPWFLPLQWKTCPDDDDDDDDDDDEEEDAKTKTPTTMIKNLKLWLCSFLYRRFLDL